MVSPTTEFFLSNLLIKNLHDNSVDYPKTTAQTTVHHSNDRNVLIKSIACKSKPKFAQHDVPSSYASLPHRNVENRTSLTSPVPEILIGRHPIVQARSGGSSPLSSLKNSKPRTSIIEFILSTNSSSNLSSLDVRHLRVDAHRNPFPVSEARSSLANNSRTARPTAWCDPSRERPEDALEP